MKRKLNFKLHITVHKPLKEVFYAFIDPEYTTQVDPPTKSAKLVQGKDFEPGAVWKLKVDGGILGTIKQKRTFLEVDAPHSFSTQVEQDGMKGPDLQSFELLDDGGVRVTWQPKYELTGMMAFLSPMVAWQVKSKGKLWMKLMKQAIQNDEYKIRGI